MKYQCITEDEHGTHKYNLLYIYDKIADVVLLIHENMPTIHENMPTGVSLDFKSIQESEFSRLINDHNESLISRVTNGDLSNLDGIMVCDIFTEHDDRYRQDYCLVNGILVKRYDVDLSTDAVDTDSDGVVDIEGDGVTTANFTVKIVDYYSRELISNFNGLVEVKVDRGKILGDNGRFVNITNGQGSFELKSIEETVSNNKIRARLMKDQQVPSNRAHISESFRITFR